MRRALLALVVAAFFLTISPGPAPIGPDEAIGRGLDALHAAGARDARTAEAVIAAGHDPSAWRGTDLIAGLSVPPADGDPITGLYTMYVIALSGADLSTWPDAVHGDLRSRLVANVPAALEAEDDAVVSFQLLAMDAAGIDDREAELRARLLAMQKPSGAWGCGPWVGPECTSYALRALRAGGIVPMEQGQRAADYLDGRRQGSHYSDPLNGADVQITAAAVRGLVALGADVPQEVIDGLVAAQQDASWHKAGRPSTWASAEVITALADATR